MTTDTSVRLIAMYLPQFHPIPENDKWWGKDFTEWTNVQKAKPLFPGHYQPHIPGPLGYYDLRDPGVRNAQAELAASYGIYGFCYYHYWFHGKQLLEFPIAQLISSGEPKFPFCICWANENWTRQWDGEDQDVLMEQTYSRQDDENFLRSLLPVFRDDRYIRVNGRPVLIIYKSGHLPAPAATTSMWRDVMAKEKIGDLYLIRIDSSRYSSDIPPEKEGFDAAMEFTPYWERLGKNLQNLKEAALGDLQLSPDIFAFDYEQCVRNMLCKPKPDYKLFRSVFPMWDNTPRRKTNQYLFVNASPAAYSFWLSRMVRHTMENFEGDERLLFVNAWNEWGEGCHLEPDEKHGDQYLEATRIALQLKDGMSASRDELLARANCRIAQDQRTIDEMRNELHAMQINFNQQTNRISQLQVALQQSKNRIDDLIKSWSWKCTAPFRFVHSLITSRKNKQP